MIVEADVLVTDQSLVGKIRTLVEFADSQKNPSIAIFLSDSFTRKEHTADNLPARLTQLDEVLLAISTDRGSTDTVAATIYSKAMIERLLDFVNVEPFAPKITLPIDQILDVFLIRCAKNPNRSLSVHLNQSICRQQSLHPRKSLRDPLLLAAKEIEQSAFESRVHLSKPEA